MNYRIWRLLIFLLLLNAQIIYLKSCMLIVVSFIHVYLIWDV